MLRIHTKSAGQEGRTRIEACNEAEAVSIVSLVYRFNKSVITLLVRRSNARFQECS